jgi:hypothetical protein
LTVYRTIGVVAEHQSETLEARDEKMNRARWSGVLAAMVCVSALVLSGSAAGQEPAIQDVPGASPVMSDELAASKTLRTGGMGTFVPEEPPDGRWLDLLPDLRGPTLTWIAVVVILVLTLQTKPLLSWHNLDGLMLALVALLLPLRSDVGLLPGDLTGQWWAYLLLSLIGLYWLVRGLKLLMAKTVSARQPNISEGAMLVLVVAGLFVAASYIVKAPLSPGSRDGLIGGIYTAETGKLPYGDALDHDARSPLLYLLHAGAVKLAEPTYRPGPEPVAMRWADRKEWLDDAAWKTVDLTAVWVVNALLSVLLFGALAGIGHRHHSVALAQTLVAIACLFPAALECLARPDIMLPTVLLAWSIAFVTVRGVGGLISVFLLVMAGLAWPWAWLALPVMLAYLFRRGWPALGATVGLLGGVAAILIGMTTLVAPTLPRLDGALGDAGITPNYKARLSDDDTVVIERYRPSATVEPTFKSWLWKPLLDREEARLDSSHAQPALPNGIDASSVMYRDVVATGDARERLQHDYRAALAQEPPATQMWASLRSLLEATWKPSKVPARPMTGVWELWAAGQPDSAGRWTVVRRTAKIVVGLLALLVAVLMIRGERKQPHQLMGALLMVSAATLLISWMGAATNWVWLMPTALATLAARSATAGAKSTRPPASELPPLDLGPAPRITVGR